jgi:hypothetical protein
MKHILKNGWARRDVMSSSEAIKSAECLGECRNIRARRGARCGRGVMRVEEKVVMTRGLDVKYISWEDNK